jgi:hypothetical protein
MVDASNAVRSKRESHHREIRKIEEAFLISQGDQGGRGDSFSFHREISL